MFITSILVVFLLTFISFAIWNIANFKELLKKPLRKDSELNDKKYWELKYKQEYMVAVFAVVVGVITWLGYHSISDIKQDVRAELASKLDSTKKAIDSIEKRQSSVDSRLRNSDSILSSAQNIILGLTDRERYLNGSLNLRNLDLAALKTRISEINEKNILQQNIYIVDNVEYTFSENWEYKKYYYRDLLTNTGQRLPNFKKPPFILPVSNEGFTFSIQEVTTESFELIPSNNTSPKYGNLKNIKATLFITEKP